MSGIDVAKISNFGGLMLWDGSSALFEDTKGIDYLDYARQVLVALSEAVSKSRPNRELTRVLRAIPVQPLGS